MIKLFVIMKIIIEILKLINHEPRSDIEILIKKKRLSETKAAMLPVKKCKAG